MEQTILRGGRYIFLAAGLGYGYFNYELKRYNHHKHQEQESYNHKIKEIKAALATHD